MISVLTQPWRLLSWILALLLFMPVVALIFLSLSSSADSEIFEHLQQTVLSSYVANSIKLVSLSVLLAAIFAVPAAWLVAVCEFKGRKIFEWALMLPLAVPGYISAYIYTDLLDYAGPVQVAMRSWFDWQSPQDYWFWDFRSISGAATVLALGLFPYIYLILKNTFARQEANIISASRLLGASLWRSFWKIALPVTRPALAIGCSLVAMEVVADFAVANLFAISTLTTAVYDSWLSLGSLSAAAKISALMLVGILALLFLENISRRKHAGSNASRDGQAFRVQLSAKDTALAIGFCSLLLLLGFVLPALVLADYAVDYFQQAWNEDLYQFSLNSFWLAFISCVVAAFIAVSVNYARRIHHRAGLPKRLASLGYAVPGTVMAIAVLIPLTAADHFINEIAEQMQWQQPGLVLTGTVVALIFAFVCRFSPLAIGAVDAGLQKIPVSLDDSAKLLGAGQFRLLAKIHLPLLKGSIMTAALLVFIEVIKELPAALLLRPFNYDTLATYVYQFASDEQLELASLGALTIVLVSLIPVMILSKNDVKN